MDNAEDSSDLYLADLLAELIGCMGRQEQQLERLIAAVSSQSQTLGFATSPRPTYVYCNRNQGGNWYTIDSEKNIIPITADALIGFVEKLEFKQVERRKQPTWKLHLTVRADKRYILEAGYDSNFSKNLLAALAIMTIEQLRGVITIQPQPADSDEVLFCRIYSGGELVFAPWDDQTNWKITAKRALDNVQAAQPAPSSVTPIDAAQAS